MSQIIALKIDLAKLDEARLFKGKNGAEYLDAVLFVNDEADQYGNCGMITQAVSKEERAAKVRGNILGNGRILSGEGAPRKKYEGTASHVSAPMKKAIDDNLPF